MPEEVGVGGDAGAFHGAGIPRPNRGRVMTTTKNQMRDALVGGDTLESLSCIYQKDHKEWDEGIYPLIYCKGNELPEREYYAGFGGVEGELAICYGKNHVYVKVEYDGSEHFQAVPLSIENVQEIPMVGGG